MVGSPKGIPILITVLIVVIAAILIALSLNLLHSPSINTSTKVSRTHFVTSSMLYRTSGAGGGKGTTISIANHSRYSLVLRDFVEILREARDTYLRVLKLNKTYLLSWVDNFSKALIFNGSIINASVLRVGDKLYRFVIIFLYDGEKNIGFMPKEIVVEGIEVRMLPRTVTWTGIVPYDYLLKYDGRKCKITFGAAPGVDASPSLPVIGRIERVCPGVYAAKLVVVKKFAPTVFKDVWFILIEQSKDWYKS